MLAIKVSNLTKKYKIYPNPVDRLKEIIFRKSFHKEFIALDNISFNVFHGETIGIVGDNGAGKSTLLKILAGTLTPTSGEVIKNGSVAALLELGAGFHPDFTGRQNIYLNASLLGLTDKEIKSIEKEIIEFAELEDFIDIPVKTYSSGMYVRLAFSIATSVDPDILIIDEALSVGDQHFQKKCIDRMHKFRNSGKTIIFCSHSLYHLNELCEKGLWLHKGKIKMIGAITNVIKEYQNYVLSLEKNKDKEITTSNEKIVYITDVWLTDLNGNIKNKFNSGESIKINMKIKTIKKKIKGHIGFGIYRLDDILIYGNTTHGDNLESFLLEENKTYSIIFPKINLLSGKYKIVAAVIDETGLHFFDIFKKDILDINSAGKGYGIIDLSHEWVIK